MTSTQNTSHRWKFYRAGGLDQVKFESGADLLSLNQLDQKLWVALSCPTKGLEFDSRTLDLIDSDKDGRIRVPELCAAIHWAAARLKSADELLKTTSGLTLASINDSTPEGKTLLAAAKQILLNLGKNNASELTVADTSDTARIFAQTKFNGDGIVPATAADEATAKVINEIIDSIGSTPDRSNQPGVNGAQVAQFFAELQAYADWWKTGEAGVLPLGKDTPAAYDAYKAVKAKIEDFFARCRLTAFDARAAAHLNRSDSEYAALAAKDLSTLASEISALPLAQIAAGKPLNLAEGINPAWSGAIATFASAVVKPLSGAKTLLTENDWAEIVAKFSAFEAWASAKKGSSVEKLGLGRIKEILGSDSKTQIEKLLAQDLALAAEVAAIDDLDRLARYQRDLLHLVHNFASFADFYDPARPAIFQCGTLYLDSRSCDLCIRVDDPGAHAALATLSKCYIAYIDCRRPGGASMKVAAVFSNGDSDFLMVGRNGLFYDCKGQDWDATIIKVIDNPISIRQAFWSPYKKFIRMIEEQVAKRAAAAEAASDNKLASAASATANADKAAKPEPKKFDVGTIAALGVAVSGVVGVLTAIIGGILGLKLWQIPLAVVGVLLVISTPSMLIAWLKLRQRTLGPILEANGWAINSRVKINIPLGTSFTAIAKIPATAQRSVVDPFEDKEAAAARRRVILVLFIAALAVAAWLIRRDHNDRGHYFWQSAPAVETAPAAPTPQP